MKIKPVEAVRDALSDIVTEMRDRGLHSEPVAISDGDRPHAVIIPWPLFSALVDDIDTVLSAQAIRERLDATAFAGGPTLTTLEQMAAEAGVDVNELVDGDGLA